jgi:hypothetical protein
MTPHIRLFAISFFMLFSSQVRATTNSCAVTEMTPDGFVALRSGPGANFTMVRKILSSDGLYGDFTECGTSAGGKAPLCDRSGHWLYVAKICPLPGCSMTGERYEGWISRKYIRFVGCE